MYYVPWVHTLRWAQNDEILLPWWKVLWLMAMQIEGKHWFESSSSSSRAKRKTRIRIVRQAMRGVKTGIHSKNYAEHVKSINWWWFRDTFASFFSLLSEYIHIHILCRSTSPSFTWQPMHHKTGAQTWTKEIFCQMKKIKWEEENRSKCSEKENEK